MRKAWPEKKAWLWVWSEKAWFVGVPNLVGVVSRRDKMASTWRRMVSGGKKFSFTRQKRRKGTRHEFIKIQPEVKEALHSGKPVVALETTILTHGMPYPWNIQ